MVDYEYHEVDLQKFTPNGKPCDETLSGGGVKCKFFLFDTFVSTCMFFFISVIIIINITMIKPYVMHEHLSGLLLKIVLKISLIIVFYELKIINNLNMSHINEFNKEPHFSMYYLLF